MSLQNIVLSIGVLAALVLGTLGFTRQPATVVQTTPPFGALSGPDVSFRAHFLDDVITGGNDFATSSRGSVTYTASMFSNARVIEHNAEAATTATLPTNANLSSVGFLPNVGDTAVTFIHASTTKITLVGSTGTSLLTSASTTVVNAGAIGRLECARLGATENRLIQCLLTTD